MIPRERFWILLLFAVALAALVFLSSGLEHLEFAPGQLSLHRETEEALASDSSGQQAMRSELVDLLFRVLGIVVLFLLPLSIVYVIVSPQARKRVLRSLALLLWIVAAAFVLRNQPELVEQLQPEIAIGAPIDDSNMPTVEFTATPPSWLATLATIVFALLVAICIVSVAWYVWRQSHRPAPSLQKLAQEAQKSLAELRSGADPQDTIMRCYLQMSRVLAEDQGVHREATMTPREFEQRLDDAGLPEEPVRALTRLFERVRYGAKIATGREERQAVAALTAIVEASRSRV